MIKRNLIYFLYEKYMNLVTSLGSEEVCSGVCGIQAVCVLVLHRRSSNVLELHRQHAFVFSLGLCMFSCKITGTCSKSNGPNVWFRAILLEPVLNRMGLMFTSVAVMTKVFEPLLFCICYFVVNPCYISSRLRTVV